MRNRGHRAYTSQVTSRPAVFIDRDGTLTDEVGYVNHPSRLRLLPRSAAAVGISFPELCERICRGALARRRKLAPAFPDKRKK